MDDKWIKEAPLNSAGFDVEAQHFESLLLQAAYKVDNCKSPNESLSVILEDPLIVERPKGYSRCSSSAQRASYVLGVEDSCHRACDVICYQVLPPLLFTSLYAFFQYLRSLCLQLSCSSVFLTALYCF